MARLIRPLITGILAGFLFTAAVIVLVVNIAESHHTGVPCGAASGLPTGDARCLPLMDRSWAVDQLRATGQLTWCMNQRASNYPNLRNQIREVLANHETNLGIDWIEIAGTYETPTAALNAGCQVQHNMPEVHGCPECGGWIHYLNRPVLIEYNPHRGITLFQTTNSHEVVHLYGLHEHYDDANFLSHRNSKGFWAFGLNRSPGTATDAPTVMDFGTGVWRLTAYDVKYTCQSIDRQGAIFAACGFQEPASTFPFWDGEKWVFEAWDYYPSRTNPFGDPVGEWFDKAGVSEWGQRADYPHGFAVHNRRTNAWHGEFTQVSRCVYPLPGGPWSC